jgi:methionyl-tRNA synthetase
MARYLTTTLPYVNAEPHIGFALELVHADVLARAWRLAGEEVFFSTGTDEHGQKIYDAAQKQGKDVQEYVDFYAARVEGLKDVLALTPDNFIRTTSEVHKEAAREMWRRCDAAGDIYKKAYSGTYCVGCEAYKTEKDLTPDGTCELHPSTPVQVIEEENYFFRLSKYQQDLEEYLSHDGVILPEWRRLEALNFVRGGLEDFSISRSKEKLTWGVPVPKDESQVMYVWFDALTDYISTLGWPEDAGGNYKKFWEEGVTVQVAGKDQVRFQSVMWQAMLMSAKIKTTDQVFYHGFINSNGQRMSKSTGNVISPYELVEKYGVDATRYLLLRHVHPTEDSDITWERLDECYTAHLVNGLGNLVSRVMKLAQDHLPGPVSLVDLGHTIDPSFFTRLEAFSFQEAMNEIFALVGEGDEFMTSQEPFKKIKVEDTAGIARADIAKLVSDVARIALYLAPFMPSTSVRILDAVHTNTKPENLFPRLP